MSLREKIVTRASALTPVILKLPESRRRQHGIAIRTVLAAGYVYPHIFTIDVFTSDAAYFAYPEAGTVHEDDHGPDLRIIDRVDECCHFLSGRNKRYILVKPSHRDLSLIPRLMQNIHGEESELRDRSVDRAISEMACLLEMLDEKAHLIPRDIGRIFPQKIEDEVQIGRDVGPVRLEGVIGKTAKSDHGEISVEIIFAAHKKASFHNEQL